MALSILLGTMVTRCQQRANRDGDGQIETTEWKSLISELYGELHGAVSEVGSRYFETEATLDLTALALPANHLSTIGVDFVFDAAGHRRELAEIMVQERTYFAGTAGPAYMFSLTGANIALYPTPTTGTYKHLYVPQPTDYSSSADATSIDFISTHGAAFVVWGVAAIALHRGESAQQRAMAERDAAKDRLVSWAISRALTMPKRRVVTHIDLGRLDDPNGFWNPASWRYG